MPQVSNQQKILDQYLYVFDKQEILGSQLLLLILSYLFKSQVIHSQPSGTKRNLTKKILCVYQIESVQA